MRLIVEWLIVTFEIIITALILPGVQISGFFSALFAAIVLGLINIFIRPALLFISAPVNAVTFGLFTFVINALLVLLASAIVPGFRVRNFGWAILFVLVFMAIHYLINWFFGFNGTNLF